MAGVEASISLSIAAKLIGSADLGNPTQRLDPILEALSLTQGTDTLGKADLLFADSRTLAASASENLDLAGVLQNAFGATFTAAEIVLLFVKAKATNVNNVVVGGAASNAFVGPLGATGLYTIKPGEYFFALSKSGWAVTGGTADLLKVLNGGAGTWVDYDIVVIGRSVAA